MTAEELQEIKNKLRNAGIDYEAKIRKLEDENQRLQNEVDNLRNQLATTRSSGLPQRADPFRYQPGERESGYF